MKGSGGGGRKCRRKLFRFIPEIPPGMEDPGDYNLPPPSFLDSFIVLLVLIFLGTFLMIQNSIIWLVDNAYIARRKSR